MTSASVEMSGREAARRRRGVEQRRQLVGLDRDQIGGVLGEIRVGREHRRDRLADIAQPVPRQQRLAIGAQRLAGRVAKIDRRQIGDVLAASRPPTTPGAASAAAMSTSRSTAWA